MQLTKITILGLLITAPTWAFSSKHHKFNHQNFLRSHQSEVDYDAHMDRDALGQNTNAPVDYYMLTISYSPSFCENLRQRLHTIPANQQEQCGIDKHYGWVIHGLWPQNSNASSPSDHPRFCQGDLPPLPLDAFAPYLKSSPSKHLLQAEWEKHGACAFKNPQDYFHMQQRLFESLVLPPNKPNKKELISFIKEHNPALRNVFIKVGRNDVKICYSKKWQPISCK